MTRKPNKEEGDKDHLIFLVHGFQGSSFDMRLIKNNIQFLFPESHYLCSQANEGNTDCEIAEMGLRFAEEVEIYVQENF